MKFAIGNCSWLVGSLRPFESLQSIVAKLAISNVLKPASFRDVIDTIDLVALARMLGERRSTVSTVIDRPQWVEGLSYHLRVGTVLRQQFRRCSGQPEFHYCEYCAANFYHSWMHNLAWMERCFVHHDQRLIPFLEPRRTRWDLDFASHLYEKWNSNFSDLLRAPASVPAVFKNVAYKEILQKKIEWDELFNPLEFTLFEPREVTGRQVSFAKPSRVSGLQRQAKPKGVLTSVVAPTQSMLACGAVSAMRGTTNHWFNKLHEWKLAFQESIDFDSPDDVRSFWDALVLVLMAGKVCEESTLLRKMIDRLIKGHETCLADAEQAGKNGVYSVTRFNSTGETSYLGFGLRTRPVCRRLVTFDLLTRLLRPDFLCSKMHLERERAYFAKDDVDFVHAAFGAVDILNSPEWRPYKAPYEPSSQCRVSLQKIFHYYLCSLEWALFRLEQPLRPMASLDSAVTQLTNDMNIVVVTAFIGEDGVAKVFMGPEVNPPDWSTLAEQEPDHVRNNAETLHRASLEMPQSYEEIMGALKHGRRTGGVNLIWPADDAAENGSSDE